MNKIISVFICLMFLYLNSLGQDYFNLFLKQSFEAKHLMMLTNSSIDSLVCYDTNDGALKRIIYPKRVTENIAEVTFESSHMWWKYIIIVDSVDRVKCYRYIDEFGYNFDYLYNYKSGGVVEMKYQKNDSIIMKITAVFDENGMLISFNENVNTDKIKKNNYEVSSETLIQKTTVKNNSLKEEIIFNSDGLPLFVYFNDSLKAQFDYGNYGNKAALTSYFMERIPKLHQYIEYGHTGDKIYYIKKEFYHLGELMLSMSCTVRE